MTGQIRSVVLALAGAVMLASCATLEEAVEDLGDSEVIKLDDDLRTYAREARANLARLPAAHRAAVEPVLATHEAALRRFDRISAMGQTRKAVQTPLLAVGATLVLDDASGACIDRYVDCQVNGRRNFARSRCQPCMDQCLGQGYRWPSTRGCRYR